VQIVSKPTVELFTKRAFGHRALGWDTAEGSFGSGKYLGENAYGHTGFTGTSIWIDPDRQMFMILLTNRVHAAKAKRPAKVISDVRADLSDAAVLAVMDDDMTVAHPAKFRADREIGWNPEPPRRHALHRNSKHHRTLASHRGAKSAKKKTSKASSTAKKKHTAKTKAAAKPKKHHAG
jgi:hypothetical protein